MAVILPSISEYNREDLIKEKNDKDKLLYLQKNTLDKSFGVMLPINKGNSGYFNSSYTTRDWVKSNLKNLLLTWKGERLGNPNFGTNWSKVFFEQNDEALEDIIEKIVMEAVIEYQIPIEIENIEFDITSNDKDKNTVNFSIFYTINNLSPQIEEVSGTVRS